MNMVDWAKNEIEIACNKENPNWKNSNKDWDYGTACLQSAFRAFESLCADDHSGLSIGITKNILNRLIDGKPLTPVTDEDFFTEDEDAIKLDHTYFEKTDIKGSMQCPRMSSLFREEDLDGTIHYHDTGRIICKDVITGSTYYYGIAANMVDEYFPITMPYYPASKQYVVEMIQFKYNKDDKNNDWDTEAFLNIKTPDGEKIEINKYYKFDEDDTRVEISKEEFEERKSADV